MFRRRERAPVATEISSAFERFRACLEDVEDAKASLVAAVPHGRGEGLPLAESLAGFESGLARARHSMDRWRLPAVEAVWWACEHALEDAMSRAETFRLEASPQGYEELAPALAELMEPLAAFETALGAFRDLGA